MNEHNVVGWERALSLAVGIAGVGSGFRRGGVIGLLHVAASLMAVKRGLTGHCALKSALAEVPRAPQPARQVMAPREAEVGIPGGAYNVRPTDVVPGADHRLDDQLGQPQPKRDAMRP